MADPPDTDPDDMDPRERDLERRSDMPAVSPWVVVGGLLMLGALAYAVAAMA
ncbi:hypothetical protein [Brevundimonas lenta]|uniref:Uncharacterized protein n=1 Tax=Brevundimonas lenta TaxID=424796 RepID=A0A7W6JEN4_9CAUL|nr:hypothetical protein [Brevundimonas lenta]MBB4083724.1 hypothetical protein [Brevundimonas lenta]